MGKTRSFEFHWEFEGLTGDFIIRTRHEDYDNRNSPLRKDCPIELIKRNKTGAGNTYVVAWFRVDKDGGYNLEFIGNRPMKDIEPEEIASIWEQLQAAQEMLDAFARACDCE